MSPVVMRINGWARRVPTLLGYPVLLLPAAWMWAQAIGGAYPDPVKTLEHTFGTFALQLLIASLVITPLLHQTRINLVRFRRMIGLTAFYYLLMHFAVWLVFDMQLAWGEIAADLFKRPYIVVGMLALVALIPVAATSNAWMIRKLDQKTWHRVHWWVYPATIAGGVHYLMQSKAFNFGGPPPGLLAEPTAAPAPSFPVEPTVYLLIITALVAYRPLRRMYKARQRAVSGT